MAGMHKYPRTPHLEGSPGQPGDEDLDFVPVQHLAGRFVVIEEKLDGANAGISFDSSGQMLLQSRGHYLTGGGREKHFALFKTWASRWQSELRQVLKDRYVLYGEWLYAKHTIFYDQLPHYFLEFDVLDLETATFLSTQQRRLLLTGSPVASVPVVHEGPWGKTDQLQDFIRPSLYKSLQWRSRLHDLCVESSLDPQRVIEETDRSDLSEGLYIKAEEADRVIARYKFVRASFLTSVLESESHWLNRPIVRNLLHEGASLF
jgi:hypothetical protein